MDRAADNHYPTSCTEVIAARDVASIAADGCVLFLWATAPMLPQALEVLTAWGFEYRSHVVWVKDHIGTGYWFRTSTSCSWSERGARFQRRRPASNGRQRSTRRSRSTAPSPRSSLR
jgi:N6-adenosine-specific RNA methylase IME4